MLRFVRPLRSATSRRAYSIFSSKPGGGRYFNSAKPHKVAPTTATTSSTTKAKTKPDDGSSSSSSSPTSASDDPATKTLGKEDPSSVVPPSSFPAPPHVPPRLPPHPTFSGHTYPLHHFFSLHRPLLLLPLATSTLFETPSTSFDEATTSSPQETTASPSEEIIDPSNDADADAARQLARALALNRVGGWIDWEETLARLGDAGSIRALQTSTSIDGFEHGVNLDSTKRKKRKKMSKHKYKKRRRLQRAERRKMGK